MAGRPPSKNPDTWAGRLGHRLRLLRERRGLGAVDVATRLEVSPATLWRWEQGHAMPLDALPALAAALGYRVRTLLPDE